MKQPNTQHTIEKIRVWDAPTRTFHWILALCFAGAVITQEMESLRLVHITFGYTMLGLVGFRVFWGFWGSRYARFKDFLPTPRKVIAYSKGVLRGAHQSHLGHNPLGALAIIAMLTLTIGTTASGILIERGLYESVFEDVHETLANALLLVVIGHLAGVLLSSVLHKESLVSAMINGYKLGSSASGIRANYTWVAVLLAAAIAYLWFVQFA